MTTVASLTRVALMWSFGVAGLLLPSGVGAQARWLPRLQLDNDVYNLWTRHTRRPDEQYTNGVRASLESMDGAWWGVRLAPGTPDCRTAPEGQACRMTRLTLGQDLYTPNLDRVPYEVAGWEQERPFFAWLYLRQEARVASPRLLNRLSLSIGVTGPPAGGQLAQRLAHTIGFNDLASGWETQIGFEPGIVAEWRQSALVGRVGDDRGPGIELAPEWAASLGNVRTHAELGASLRFGWNLSHPWSPAERTGRAGIEWWMATGGRVTGVARDMSLDGTWNGPERRVERMPGVAQYEVGVGLRVKGLAVEYRAVTRSREYRTGPLHHAYSAVVFSLVPVAKRGGA